MFIVEFEILMVNTMKSPIFWFAQFSLDPWRQKLYVLPRCYYISARLCDVTSKTVIFWSLLTMHLTIVTTCLWSSRRRIAFFNNDTIIPQLKSSCQPCSIRNLNLFVLRWWRLKVVSTVVNCTVYKYAILLKPKTGNL